jgi:hypothetical protein
MSRSALIPAILSWAVVLAAGGCGRLKPQASPLEAGVGPDAGGGAGMGGAPDAAGAAGASTGAADGGGAEAAPPASATLVKTIALPGIPTSTSTYNAGTKKAYFACETAAKASAGIAVVDDATNEVVTTITPAGPVVGLAANAMTKKVYAAEGDQVEIIDSVTDTVLATVKTPDGAVIAGLAVDEPHDLVYLVATKAPQTGLYVLEGVPSAIRYIRFVLLTPSGAPPIAVDPETRRVFVMGADSNGAGLIITLDGLTGGPQRLVTTDSLVSATASGVVSLGAGKAAALFLEPDILKRIGEPDVYLPAGFTPTGIAATGSGNGSAPSVVIDGFGANGRSQVHVLDGATGQFAAYDLALGGGTVAAGILVTAPASGIELYVDGADPKSDPPAGLAATTKVKLR